MKKLLLIGCGWTLIISGMAQSEVALENKPHALQERYYLMKTKSETYQDYKVIKEYVMDGVWKIANDSLVKREKELSATRQKIDTLQNKLSRARTELKSKTDSMADIVFAGGHINVFGKNFSKTSFLILISIAGVALILTISLLLTRLKEMQKFVKESQLIINGVKNEFEEYRHKAMEKQIKLARELQTERNKLFELLEQSKPLR